MTFSDPATLGNVTGFLYICSGESFKHILWLLVVGRGVMLRPIFLYICPWNLPKQIFFSWLRIRHDAILCRIYFVENSKIIAKSFGN